MGWYCFKQNNSHGYYDVTETLCQRLYIEEDYYPFVLIKAQELGCYWHGVARGIDCSCCGDRWNLYWQEPINLNKYNGDIRAYAQKQVNDYCATSPGARIFYKDGRVEEIYKENKEE